MKRNHHFKFTGILLFGLSVLFLTSCSQGSDNLAAIPKETNFVSVINLYSLAQKGKLGEISDRNFFQSLKNELQSESKKLAKLVDNIMEAPAITGIDVKADIFGYYVVEERSKQYACLSAKLNSEDKFGNFIKELLSELEIDFNIEKGKNYKYILADGEFAITWDTKKALVLIPLSPDGRRSMEAEIEILMTLKSKDQITNNDDFNKFYENKKDISFWVSSNILEDYILEELLRTTGVDYSNSYFRAYFNFEKGKVSLLTQFIPNEELKLKMKEYSGNTIPFNDNLFQYLPETSYAAMSVTLDPMAFYNALSKESGFDDMDMAALFKEGLGMDMKEFFESFKGSILFSLFDFRNVEMGYSSEMLPVMGLIFDINSSQIIKSVIKKAGILDLSVTKQDSYYQLTMDELTVYIAFSEKECLLTNDKNAAEAFQNSGFGKESLGKNPIRASMTKNTVYGYWNLNFDEYPEIVKEKIGNNFGGSILKLWNSFARNLEFRSVDEISSEFILNLQDDTNNSLYSIINFTDNVYKEIMH